ncbi:MAG: M23 family metallopeptidase [Raineya sp.]|jgi:murein DD-endopeptidase MepM/ murein hydrolase activator NlpD|nr:M23 family metallopeptidase [Raineya sp.]
MKNLILCFFCLILFNCSNSTHPIKLIQVRINNGITDYYAINKVPCPVTLKFKFDSIQNLYNPPSNYIVVPAYAKKHFIFRLRRQKDSITWHYRFYRGYTWGDPDLIYDSTYIYDLPFEKGITTKIIKNDSIKQTVGSNYLELSAKKGTIVKAIRNGTIVGLDYNTIIYHDDGSFAFYQNLEFVYRQKRGDRIKKGEPFGEIGVDSTQQTNLKVGVFKVQKDGILYSIPLKFDINGTSQILSVGKEYTAFK